MAVKINRVWLKEASKDWITNPFNMALLLWIVCVTVSGAILFMVMTGMLNRALPTKPQRDAWFEASNQILNALFTLMCLYLHPRRFHDLVLLSRWRPEDILKLRRKFCKNGANKPRERTHMAVVIGLLHLNCFAQYTLCGLNWGYPRSRRPPIGVGICISAAIASPIVATMYNILSPLGRDYEVGTDEEAQSSPPEERYSFAAREDGEVELRKPQWKGGLFDLWEDLYSAYLSLFCCFCVFGWNMDKLGFGNMYVHIATFALLCVAPFWIFNLAGINIDNDIIREALGFSGVVLCLLGLLYGGFWRIQMRKRFGLPANPFCCGYPAATDCFQWLCCCFCSLAQEARTAHSYNVVQHGFYGNHGNEMSPLPREDGTLLFRPISSSPVMEISSQSLFGSSVSLPSSPSPRQCLNGHRGDPRLLVVDGDVVMRAPDPPRIN